MSSILPSVRSIFTAPAIASVFSALLTFIPNPTVSGIGLASSMGLGGYAVAATKTDPRRQRQLKGMAEDRNVRSLKQELADVQTRIRNLSRDKKNLASELTQGQAARAGLVAKNKALTLELGSKAHTPAVDICQYTEQLKSLKATIAEKDRAIADLNLLLNHNLEDVDLVALRNKTIDLLRGVDTSVLESEISQLQADKQKLSAAYKSLNSALDNAGLQYDAELSELGGIKDAQDNEALATIHHWKQQAAILTSRINELEAEAKKPGRFGGTGAADVMGNRVIDFFQSKGCTMVAHDSDPDLDKGLLVSLKADTPIDLETVRKFMGELEVFTKTHSKPTVTYEGRHYRFRLAVNEPFRPADESKLTSNIKRLQKAIDLANHLSIFGGSGSGKSTFLDNAIWCGKCLWPDSKLDILDPKYPFTPWTNLKPTYKGGESTIDGVIAISKVMNKRLKDATVEYDETGIVPEYPRYIFAIDEATVALTEAKRLDQLERKGDKLAVNFGASLSSLLRLGRALNVKGYFLTQSLLVSKVGLNDGDYDNTTRVYLNAMIDKALDGELKELFSDPKVAAIRRELQRRKDAGHEYIGLVADTNRDDLFLFEPPAPGYYHEQYQLENDTPFTLSETPSPHVPAKSPKHGKSAASSVVDAGNVGVAETIPPTTARCPKCQERSTTLHQKAADKNGRYRFKCLNVECGSKTFRASSE